MSEKLSKNLDLLMMEARLSAGELSRRTNLPASTIKKIRNNNDANPTLSTLTPLAKYFSISISQLIGDEPLSSVRTKGTYNVNTESLLHIPLITWHDTLHWPDVPILHHIKIASEHTYSKTAFALLVEEEDWENLAKDTLLLIDPAAEIDHRDFVIVHKTGQKIPAVKQALFDEGEMYLKPVKEGYNMAVLTPEHKILGVVVEYKKQLKKVIAEKAEET